MTDISSDFPRGRSRRFDRFEFKLLVALTYPLFLVAAMLSRLLFRPADGASSPRPSVFAEARAHVEGAIALAFSG